MARTLGNQNIDAVSLHAPTDLRAQFINSIAPRKAYESIIDFATHRSFCNKKLYPRQRTLLKLIYLETEHMTAYDVDVIEEWRANFSHAKIPHGIQADVWERVDYLKRHGYTHFPHVQAVMGRRASKGTIGGILGAERLAFMLSLDNPQAYFGVEEAKNLFLHVVATNMIQAKQFQFADIRSTIESCKFFEPYISTSKEYYLSLRTNADKRRIAEFEKRKMPIDHEIASLRCLAMSSTSSSGRGSTAFANFFDEFAHMITTTEGPRSSSEVYNAYQPALDQFGKDSLTYVPSSPYCLEKSTPVLTEDLRWVPVGDLRIGDRLIGFDEDGAGPGKGRTWQPAMVTETSVIHAPRYEITMRSGKKIVSTGEHMWLCSWASQISRWDWRKTNELKRGDRIKTIGCDPWEEEDSKEAGYLAGFFDGEGFFSKQGLIGASQNRGKVLDDVLNMLDRRKFDIECKFYNEKLDKFYMRGGMAESMRFLGTLRPTRLLDKFTERFYGTRIYSRGGPNVDYVESVQSIDHGEVIALGTSTNTLVADGLLSHNTKVGQFYDLYTTGGVLMREYLEKHGMVGESIDTDLDPEEEFVNLTANPEMLIVQLPSWALYEDWERSKELGGPRFARPIQQYDERLKRLEAANPEKFKVERKAQFAEVEDAYLNPDKVDAMFEPFWDGRRLGPNLTSQIRYQYEMHMDPGLSNANFALCIAHLEDSPYPDEHGFYWPNVIVDYLHVWQPKDFPDHTIDYVQVEQEVEEFIAKFPSMNEATSDRWNSASMIARLKVKFGNRPRIRVAEFTKEENLQRAEYFKSALNLGWVHCYRDNFFGEGQSLLEQELKFLSTDRQNRVVKQEFGPVTTKDMADCLFEVSYRLLHESLDSWQRSLLGIPVAKGNRGGDPTGDLYGMEGRRPNAAAARRALEEIKVRGSTRRMGIASSPRYTSRTNPRRGRGNRF